MNPLFAAALELQQFFEARAWRFCFIGGLAVQRWGEPRLTLDVDCTVLTGFGQEARYVDELLAAFTGRVNDARDFALAIGCCCCTELPVCRSTSRSAPCPSRSVRSNAPPASTSATVGR